MIDLVNIYKRGQTYDGDLYRLKAVLEAARSGEKIRTAFIGGSITQGCHATKKENEYTKLFTSYLKNKYLAADIEYFCAAVGATDSQFGCARIDKQLLVYEPDILVVEFSVNDSADEFHKETYEGLIRHILVQKKVPAIICLMNVQYNAEADSAYEEHLCIAKHYHLPALSMKDAFLKEIQEGRINASDMSLDKIHPTDLGHKYIAGLMSAFIDRVDDTEVIHEEQTLPDPLTLNRYQNPVWYRNMDINPVMKDFIADNKKPLYPGYYFINGWSSKKSGAYIEFNIKARGIAVQYQRFAKGPSPIAALYLDDEMICELDSHFDEDWGDLLYLQNIFMHEDKKDHNIRIVLTNVPENGNEFYLVSIIAYM